MAMTKARKHVLKGEIAERLKKANAALVAEYRGLTVAELTDLRVRLRESQSEFRVVKNRVTKVAIREEAGNVAAISDSLKGPVGLVIVYGDPAKAAKSASKATGLGLRPAETIREPSAATIAPLSVHSPGLGTRSWIPAFSHRSSATARSLELAATPPAITNESIPDCLHAANAFSNSTSTIAS